MFLDLLDSQVAGLLSTRTTSCTSLSKEGGVGPVEKVTSRTSTTTPCRTSTSIFEAMTRSGLDADRPALARAALVEGDATSS